MSRTNRVNERQKRALLLSVKSRPHLFCGKFSNKLTYQNIQSLWKEIAEEVNASGNGPPKTDTQWKKTWDDMRRGTKKKAAKIASSQRQTGSGSPMSDECDSSLTPLELEVLAVLGGTAPLGDLSVPVSSIFIPHLTIPEESLTADVDAEDTVSLSDEQQEIVMEYSMVPPGPSSFYPTLIPLHQPSSSSSFTINHPPTPSTHKLTTAAGKPSRPASNPVPSSQAPSKAIPPATSAPTPISGIKISSKKTAAVTEPPASQTAAKNLASYQDDLLALRREELDLKREEIGLKKQELVLKERKVIALESIAKSAEQYLS